MKLGIVARSRATVLNRKIYKRVLVHQEPSKFHFYIVKFQSKLKNVKLTKPSGELDSGSKST